MHRMSLRTLGRRVKIMLLKQENDVCELLFSNEQAQHACRFFLNELRSKHGLTKLNLTYFLFICRMVHLNLVLSTVVHASIAKFEEYS